MPATISFDSLFLPITARRMIGKVAEVTQTRRPRWMADYEIIDIADDADTGSLSADELEDFRAIDLALRGIDKISPTGDIQYVIVECVPVITAADVTRARRNADYLAQFTGVASKAVVIGIEIPPAVANLAEQVSVHCIVYANKGAGSGLSPVAH